MHPCAVYAAQDCTLQLAIKKAAVVKSPRGGNKRGALGLVDASGAPASPGGSEAKRRRLVGLLHHSLPGGVRLVTWTPFRLMTSIEP